MISDFGANKTLTGGLCLQTLETWQEFIGTNEVSFGGNNAEVYFEEDQFDQFTDRLKNYDKPVQEHAWGQRMVRFYDPDRHIIEVGENLNIVCRCFLERGMTPEQVAKRMDVPMKFVRACMRKLPSPKITIAENLASDYTVLTGVTGIFYLENAV